MENTQQIYQKINELAAKLAADNSSLTRADLAYELKDLGVSGDSPEISRYVYEALRQSGNERLAPCFVNNSKSETLINEYQVTALLEQGDQDTLFGAISKKLSDTNTTLGQLSQLIDEKTKLQLIEGASTLINVVSGSEAVNRIQSEASAIFMKYSEMAGGYTKAKDSIRSLASDFGELRQSTSEMYRKYANSLVDIFGDRIKATMPEMFDFSQVKFLDVEGMLQQRQLSYNSIYGKCKELVGEVSDSFAKSLKLSASQFSQQKDKRVGLVMAGINMLTHYMKTGQQTQGIRKELTELKSSISHDVATIKTDEVRLLEIFKTLNDVFIPKAEIFAKSAPQVFDSEFQQLLDTLYNTPELKELREGRDKLISDIRKLERSITDEQMSINYYTSHVADSQDFLNSMQDQYQKARDSKPVPPSGLGNLLSFGTAKKNYNRDIYDWTQNCAPLVSKYEDLIVDIKVDNDELNAQKMFLEADKQEYEAKLRALNFCNSRIQESIQSSPELKAKVLAHLDDIIKLLQLAKEVSQSKLDSRLIETANVKKFKDVELPENLKKAVDDFKAEVTKDMNFTAGDVRNLTGKDDLVPEIQDAIVAQGKDVVAGGISLCEQLAQLSAMQLNQALAQEYYDMEYNKIKAQFSENMKGIDNEMALIQEIARQINTSDNPEALKKSLFLLLKGKDSGYTADDYEQMLAGNKTINI